MTQQRYPPHQRFQLIAISAAPGSDDWYNHAVLQSLLNYAKAQSNDPIDAGANKQGWWANEFLSGVGCRDWTLRREKQTDETKNRARIHTEKALQWLIDDGWAKQAKITLWYEGEALKRQINLTKPDGTIFEVTL